MTVDELGCVYTKSGYNVTPRLLNHFSGRDISTLRAVDFLRAPGCGRVTARAIMDAIRSRLPMRMAPLAGHKGNCAKVISGGGGTMPAVAVGVSFDAPMAQWVCLACGCRWDARHHAPTDCPECPSLFAPRPLAGHHGDCAKVTSATITGSLDARCDCGKEKQG